MLLVDAIFINNSGGLKLLGYLLKELSGTDNIHYLIDERIKGKFSFRENQVTYLSNSLWKRHLFYLKNKHSFSTVFCFGNLPPTLKLDAQVYTYFHNVLFFEMPYSYPIKQKFSKFLKGIVLQFLAKNSDEFWVQSKEVKKLLLSNISSNSIKVIPFYENAADLNSTTRNEVERRNNFCFISNGNSHKNHINILAAWQIINLKRQELILHLTVTDLFPSVLESITNYQNQEVNIKNHGWVDVQTLFNSCGTQVYPSLAESFGLGLVESIENGCEVIASDLPYAHEVVEAMAWFDPKSPQSIAEAVLKCDTTNREFVSKVKIKNEMDQIIKKLTS